MKNRIDVFFRNVHHSKGVIDNKIFSEEDGKVCLEGGCLYYGRESNWRVKVKDIVTLEIRDDSVEILTEDLRLLLTDPVTSLKKNPVEKFCRRLQNLHEKHHGPPHSVSRFVESSSRAALGSPQRRGQRKTTSRRPLGSLGRTNETTLRRNPLKSNEPNAMMSWSDDEKEEQGSVENQEQQDEDHGEQELAFPDQRGPKDNTSDQSETESAGDVVDPPPKKPRRGRFKRIGKAVIDDDSDEDDLFTTPQAKHIVSPSRTATKPTIEEDGESDDDSRPKSSITNFFQPKKKQSFDPSRTAKASSNSEATTTTPTRSSRVHRPFQSPHVARVVKQSHLKNMQSASENWLARSPAGAHSPSRTSANRIYGKNSPSISRLSPPDALEIFDRVEAADKSRHFFSPGAAPAVSRKRPLVFKRHNEKTEELSTILSSKPNPSTLPVAEDQITDLPTPPPRNPFRGLRNLGNTCYMNASLQMLYSIPSFVKALSGRGGDLTKSVVSVYDDLQDTTGNSPIVPENIKTAIDAKTDKFHGYEQRDAHEFVNDLLDHINEEIKTDHLSHEKDPDDFCMTLQVSLECTKCGYSRTKDEVYRNLSIDIVANGDDPVCKINDCLAQFFQPEEREIKCEKCTEGNCARQTTRVLHR